MFYEVKYCRPILIALYFLIKSPFANRTSPKKKGKEVSNEEKILEADAVNCSNPDDKTKKNEAKTEDIGVGQDPVVTNEIDVDPGTNK